MLKEGRKKIMIVKYLKYGHVDRCTVVIRPSEFDDAKKRYEAMGYRVIEL